ncbi:hypothetical protein AXX17_AT4G07660 [Arabidopsis thaliana]|uniref:Uncharacterized protein n=1 Tax=Arabidopsis thaliana TaxID=3702 RepID=A0A178UZ99_ARATH|nr:hypothetical protein AXX17_AT4G07660 [Arabidopsis thaliana]
MDSDEDSMPLQPERFFFTPKEYVKTMKTYTRCNIAFTLAVIGQKLNDREKSWFIKNRQFKHIWHMVRSDKNKVQGIVDVGFTLKYLFV